MMRLMGIWTGREESKGSLQADEGGTVMFKDNGVESCVAQGTKC